MKREIVETNDLEIEDEVEQPTADLKAARHYIDNAKLYEHFKWYHAEYQRYKDGILEKPPRATEYMGEAFIRIAHGYSNDYRFRGYTNAWKEEMVDEAIEACVRYCKSFDPAKSENPFSYITYICHTAFIKKIKAEKKNQYVRYKLYEMAGGFSAVTDAQDAEDFAELGGHEITDQFINAMEFIDHFETSSSYGGGSKKSKKQSNEPVKAGLDLLFDEEEVSV